MNKLIIRKTILILLISTFAPYLMAAKSNMSLAKNEHQALVIAQQALHSDQPDQAIELLLKLNNTKASLLAKALAQQMLGSAYQLKTDYHNALKAYEAALAYDGLPRSSKLDLFEKSHKLSYYLKDWDKSVQWWLKWEKSVKPSAEDYLLLSSAYEHQQQWAKAKKALLKAIALKGSAPQSWLQIQLRLEGHLAKPGAQIKLLSQLVEQYPNTAKYWLKLAALYHANNQPQKANALLYSAFSTGIITDRAHIYRLINNLAEQGSPNMAARVLEQALTLNYLQGSAELSYLMADLLMRAKNYQQALVVAQTLMADENIDRVQHIKYAQLIATLHFQLKQWQQAYDTALQINQDQLTANVDLQLLLAISSIYLGKKEIANEYLTKVLTLAPSNELALYWHKQL
ncbi:hypothetical protein WN093_04315 [Gammaproteobacteria bacterium AS21]